MTLSEKEYSLMNTEEWNRFSKLTFRSVQEAVIHTTQVLRRPLHAQSQLPDLRGIFTTSLRQKFSWHGFNGAVENRSSIRDIYNVYSHLVTSSNWQQPGVLKPLGYHSRNPFMVAISQVIVSAKESLTEEFQDCWNDLDSIRTDLNIVQSTVDTMQLLASRAEKFRERMDAFCNEDNP